MLLVQIPARHTVEHWVEDKVICPGLLSLPLLGFPFPALAHQCVGPAPGDARPSNLWKINFHTALNSREQWYCAVWHHHGGDTSLTRHAETAWLWHALGGLLPPNPQPQWSKSSMSWGTVPAGAEHPGCWHAPLSPPCARPSFSESCPGQLEQRYEGGCVHQHLP